MQTYIRHTVTTIYVLKGMFLSEDLKNKRNSLAGLCSYKAPAEVLATLSSLKKKTQIASSFGGFGQWGKAGCLSQLIGTAFTLASLSPWAKCTILHPFSVGGGAMPQQVGLAFGRWHRLVPQGRAAGWRPEHGQWLAFNRHCAPFHTADASNVICHWLSK